MEADMPHGSNDLLTLFSRFQPGTSVVERWSAGATAGTRMLGPLVDFPTAAAPSEVHAMAASADGRIALTAKGRLLLDHILGEIAAAEEKAAPRALAVVG
jgi:hypothetical protein